MIIQIAIKITPSEGRFSKFPTWQENAECQFKFCCYMHMVMLYESTAPNLKAKPATPALHLFLGRFMCLIRLSNKKHKLYLADGSYLV